MDGTEDSSYLTLLNDGTHNYLLQTTEDALGVQDPSLNVEPMFTEIEDGGTSWSVGLPILMNGSLMPEADQEIESPIHLPTQNGDVESTMDLPAGLPELYNEPMEGQEDSPLHEEVMSESNQMTYPIEIPGKGFITADGLFITNDLLFQLKLNLDSEVASNDGLNLEECKNRGKVVNESLPIVAEQQNMLINPKTLTPHNGQPSQQVDVSDYKQSDTKEEPPVEQETLFNGNSDMHLTNGCLSSEQIFDVTNLNTSNEVIQLLNTDGTVINISKQLLNYDVAAKTKSASPSPAMAKVVEEPEDALGNCSEFFEVVMAHKCRRCLYLCETRENMIEHWKNQHLTLQNDQAEEKVLVNNKESTLKEIEEKNGFLKCGINGEIKMKSILKNSDHQTVYVCSECNLGYGSTEKLRTHMIMVHKLVQCPADLDAKADDKQVSILTNEVKSTTNTTVPKLKLTPADIQKQAKASKKLKCSIKGCDLRFSMDDMRIRHEKCHVEGQKKQFKCFECDSKFSLWRVCSMHLWKCHKVDLGLFTCPMCSVFKASTPVRLVTHMAIHEDEKPYLCNNCGKTFKQHSQLRNHQIVHKQVEEFPEWAAQQQCDICKKFFANSKSLKKHIQSVHDKFKPFICNICGHKTARKAMLDLHLRQHTGEKPHKCPICEYKTGDHNSLRRHVMRHSGDTKYACPHCNYQSIQSTSYKNHIASKHPGLGGSYFCSLCSYHTVNENTYNSHLADHKNGLIKEISDSNDNDKESKNSIPTGQKSVVNGDLTKNNQKTSKDTDDDETQNYLLMLDHPDETVDTGGITIPAGFELQVPL